MRLPRSTRPRDTHATTAGTPTRHVDTATPGNKIAPSRSPSSVAFWTQRRICPSTFDEGWEIEWVALFPKRLHGRAEWWGKRVRMLFDFLDMGDSVARGVGLCRSVLHVVTQGKGRSFFFFFVRPIRILATKTSARQYCMGAVRLSITLYSQQ